MPRPFSPRTRVSTYLSAWMPTGDETSQTVAGYFVGGYSSSILSSIEKLSFESETLSTLSATLTTATYLGASYANSGVAGYNAGGQDSTGSISRIDKITFPADTKSTLVATVNQATWLAGFANNGTAGYSAAGYGPNLNGVDRTNTVRKLLFSTETTSQLGSTVAFAGLFGAMANFTVAGYYMGGNKLTGPVHSEIHKIIFSTDTASQLAATLTIELYAASGTAYASVAGYRWSGIDLNGVQLTTMDKITFSSDTRTNLGSILATAKDYAAGAFDNHLIAGYVGGSDTAGGTTDIKKMTYASETLSTPTSFSQARMYGNTGFADCGAL